jgi:hypothetical protein
MRVELAGPGHDAQLRALLRDHAMPGWVELALEREPDYFAAAPTLGEPSQTIVGLEGEKVVGMGCRAVRQVYLNGQAASLGYLSGLRLRESSRRGTALARGYRFLRQLHADGRAEAYVSTIIEDNLRARDALESGRAGLPRYRDLGRYLTFAVALGRWKPGSRPRPGVSVSRVDPPGLDGVLAFLDECGPRRQFFPVTRRGDFGSPALKNLEPGDVMVARSLDGRIAGVAACWDQSAYKQTRVVRYRPSLAAARPLVNAVLRAAGFPRLPDEGHLLSAVSLSLVCIRDDDPGTLAALLNAAHAEYRGRRQWLMLGMHERDPLRRGVRRLTALRYVSRLYAVCWEDGQPVVDSLEPGLVPYLDIATL